MKLTSKVLKRLIAEEVRAVKELDVPAPNAMDTARATPDVAPAGAEDAGATDVAGLRMALKKISLDSSEFKGIDSTEAGMLSSLIDELMAQARDGTASPMLKRLTSIAQG